MRIKRWAKIRSSSRPRRKTTSAGNQILFLLKTLQKIKTRFELFKSHPILDHQLTYENHREAEERQPTLYRYGKFDRQEFLFPSHFFPFNCRFNETNIFKFTSVDMQLAKSFILPL